MEGAAGSRTKLRVLLCCIARHEEPYLDEWLVYNLYGVGFDAVHVYDNSPDNSLKDLGSRTRYGARVVVTHFPGAAQQEPAYNHMLAKVRASPGTWVAFFDCDEFLVLKSRAVPDVKALVRAHGSSAARDPAVAGLYINWFLFGDSGRQTYDPAPVTERFLYRGATPAALGKSLVRADRVKVMKVHVPGCGARVLDTRGREVQDYGTAKLPDGAVDVAVLHHYFCKTKEEFLRKRQRGNADGAPMRALQFFDSHNHNAVFDDSAARVYRTALSRRKITVAGPAAAGLVLLVLALVAAIAALAVWVSTTTTLAPKTML